MSSPISWLKNADTLREPNPGGFAIWGAFATLLRFVHENNWSGACHSVSAVLHILLRTQKVESALYIGEVGFDKLAFDHSWVEVEGQVYDAAVSSTLIHSISFPPVFRGIDLTTMTLTALRYGIQSGQGYDPSAKMIAQSPVAQYMDAFPHHPKGLIGLAADLAKKSGISASSGALRKAAEQSAWRERA